MQSNSRLWAVALLAFALALAAYSLRPTPTTAQPGQPATTGMPKYTVIHTEGTNLLVVDNTKNTLYFYTCDRDKEAGADLKLRGSVDLNLVGKDTITPKRHLVEGGQPGGKQPGENK